MMMPLTQNKTESPWWKIEMECRFIITSVLGGPDWGWLCQSFGSSSQSGALDEIECKMNDSILATKFFDCHKQKRCSVKILGQTPNKFSVFHLLIGCFWAVSTATKSISNCGKRPKLCRVLIFTTLDCKTLVSLESVDKRPWESLSVAVDRAVFKKFLINVHESGNKRLSVHSSLDTFLTWPGLCCALCLKHALSITQKFPSFSSKAHRLWALMFNLKGSFWHAKCIKWRAHATAWCSLWADGKAGESLQKF